MLEEKINELRKDLNEMIDRENEDPKKILQISEELDLLILEYYKEIGIYKQ
ncbi:MAG: Spo0E family sporulation regulatory protein-aspartic acid phosphatase [Tissierella sp.]|nr:Spo0E family sporulation regulatory protein-aspartic acid phosphatase [Tissierella sp.]